MSPEITVLAGADVVSLAEGNIDARQLVERKGPAGVEEQGTFIVGFFRNLGGPVVSVDEPGLGNPVNNPWPTGVAPCARGSKTRGGRRYREAKETKRRGRGGRKSECFTVPKKRGNQPEGPHGGKGAPEHGNV